MCVKKSPDTAANKEDVPTSTPLKEVRKVEESHAQLTGANVVADSTLGFFLLGLRPALPLWADQRLKAALTAASAPTTESPYPPLQSIQGRQLGSLFMHATPSCIRSHKTSAGLSPGMQLC